MPAQWHTLSPSSCNDILWSSVTMSSCNDTLCDHIFMWWHPLWLYLHAMTPSVTIFMQWHHLRLTVSSGDVGGPQYADADSTQGGEGLRNEEDGRGTLHGRRHVSHHRGRRHERDQRPRDGPGKYSSSTRVATTDYLGDSRVPGHWCQELWLLRLIYFGNFLLKSPVGMLLSS